jgi:hypothetical protein
MAGVVIVASHVDNAGRQLGFMRKKADGHEYVRVHYGLTEIGEVALDKILVQRRATGLSMGEVRLSDMNQLERASIMGSVREGSVDFQIENGGPSSVKKRNTVGDVFFQTIIGITLVV